MLGFLGWFVYRQTAERAGKIMRHKPMNARQTAAFWIEHVLQFGGEHLKPPSMHLTWWQFYCLDTLAVIAIILILTVCLILVLSKLILRIILKKILPREHAKRE